MECSSDYCEYCVGTDRQQECTGKTEPNPCPYSEEILGSCELCDCCETQQQRCRDDV